MRAGRHRYSTDAGHYERVATEAEAYYYGGDLKLAVYQKHAVIGAQRRGIHEEYRYDALGRRVLVRTRADSLCSQFCVSAVERTVWDGDQILDEVRVPGGNDDNPDLPNGSGEQYGHVTYVHAPYVHAGGIDAPLAILRWGSSLSDPLIVPHANWRGHYDRGTNSAGAEVPQSIRWPGTRLSAYLSPGGGDEDPGPWIGSLARGMADQSGLLYRRNRYYDPATGQFTQEDPIGLAGGLNLYGYAGGDPVNFSDPFGYRASDFPGHLTGVSWWGPEDRRSGDGELNVVG